METDIKIQGSVLQNQDPSAPLFQPSFEGRIMRHHNGDGCLPPLNAAQTHYQTASELTFKIHERACTYASEGVELWKILWEQEKPVDFLENLEASLMLIQEKFLTSLRHFQTLLDCGFNPIACYGGMGAAYYNLGEAEMALRHYAEAFNYFKQAYAELCKSLGKAHPQAQLTKMKIAQADYWRKFANKL